MTKVLESYGAYRIAAPTGNVTLIAAATASAGHLFSVRWGGNSDRAMRLRAIEVEFLLTTAFTTAQEVGYDIVLASAFTVAPTGVTAVSGFTSGMPVGGKIRSTYSNSSLCTAGDMRVATTVAMTAASAPAATLDANPIARSSFFCSAVGASYFNRHDFTTDDLSAGGIILLGNEGFILRNSILMGAVGVGRWTFTPIWDEVRLGR